MGLEAVPPSSLTLSFMSEDRRPSNMVEAIAPELPSSFFTVCPRPLTSQTIFGGVARTAARPRGHGRAPPNELSTRGLLLLGFWCGLVHPF